MFEEFTVVELVVDAMGWIMMPYGQWFRCLRLIMIFDFVFFLELYTYHGLAGTVNSANWTGNLLNRLVTG